MKLHRLLRGTAAGYMSRTFGRVFQIIIVLLTALKAAPIVRGQQPGYQAGIVQWRAVEGAFQPWERQGVRIASSGVLRIDTSAAVTDQDPYSAGGFHGGDFYNGGSFQVGEAVSPITATSFAFSQAVASWNVDTPDGTWIETQIRAQVGGRWTTWYSLGIWASGDTTIARHSLDSQTDADGQVDVDTLVLDERIGPADALQVKLRLFTAAGVQSPAVRSVSVAVSTKPIKGSEPSPGNPAHWGKTLPVRQCSQMVYADGGEVWCSPTSTAMVSQYWSRSQGPCEPSVRAAVGSVYDWLYDGHGNWPFNTAYAATQNWRRQSATHAGRAWQHDAQRRPNTQKLSAYVARFTDLAQAEEWIAAGVPVVVSIAWGQQALTGAPFPFSYGHLAVLVGFDNNGNPIVNDPGAPFDSAVQRTYLRQQFEPLWLGHTGGTVYLIHPPRWHIPNL
jgi:hypothetical protein